MAQDLKGRKLSDQGSWRSFGLDGVGCLLPFTDLGFRAP